MLLSSPHDGNSQVAWQSIYQVWSLQDAAQGHWVSINWFSMMRYFIYWVLHCSVPVIPLRLIFFYPHDIFLPSGAQLWYDRVVSTLSWTTVAVVPDSYAGVFPPGAVGPLFFDYNFCSSGLISSELRVKCLNKELTTMDIVTESLAKSPHVPVAFLQVIFCTSLLVWSVVKYLKQSFSWFHFSITLLY